MLGVVYLQCDDLCVTCGDEVILQLDYRWIK